jgi:uncharacterized membrane protein YphA (DoxX/SURF4 family)
VNVRVEAARHGGGAAQERRRWLTAIPAHRARAALRIALGATFLCAVGARLGLWGRNAGHFARAFESFREYVQELNPWVPASLLTAMAVLVTLLEAGLGVALVAGLRTRATSAAAGVLLTVFAVAMSAFTGVKSAFDYSVWSAAMGAFFLSSASAEGTSP